MGRTQKVHRVINAGLRQLMGPEPSSGAPPSIYSRFFFKYERFKKLVMASPSVWL